MIVRLRIKDLVVYMHIGTYDWEKVLRQKVLVSVNLVYAEGKYDTVCYAALGQKVADFLGTREYDMLESAAMDLVNSIVQETPGLSKCRVKLEKPNAAHELMADKIAVSVTWMAENSQVA
ncbi:MAG: dihydroneopterin aldolase [Anaplasma sp.]